MEDPSSTANQASLDEVIREVRDLRERVIRLEARLEPAPALTLPAEAPSEELTPLPDVASTLPVLGRALLGIAGAYLLRSLTGYGTLPHSLGVALGAFYAAGWLILAARAPAERTLLVTMHCLTSVLILAPLVWEATLRFNVLSTWVTAGILFLFSIFGLAISWRKNLTIIAWVTTLAGMGTAAAMLVATHHILPFMLALLAIAAAIEFSACCDHWVGERWIAAIIADLAVLLMTFLALRHGGLPPGYVPFSVLTVLGVQIGLLTIYLASTAVRTLFRGLNFTAFETLQSAAAFVLCIGGALRLAQGVRAAFWGTGAFALVAGAFCYVISFAFLDHRERKERNFYTYSTFAILLVLAGCIILLSTEALTLALAFLALAALWLGGHYGRSTLRLHGALYLSLAGMASGVAGGALTSLFGSAASSTPLTPAIWLGVAAVLACYAVAIWTASPSHAHWVEGFSVFLVAANFASAAILLFTAFADLLWSASPGPAAATGTGLLTIFSVALAWAARRWSRPELRWLVFPLMLLTGYRMLMRDFTLGHTLALFVSLLLYGGALVLLPGILAKAKK